MDYLNRDGVGQDDMLLQALSHPAPHDLPWFVGAHVFPLYPGTASK